MLVLVVLSTDVQVGGELADRALEVACESDRSVNAQVIVRSELPRAAQLLAVTALRHHVPIDIEPSRAFAIEMIVLMLAYGGGIADTRAGDELHLGRVIACNTRIDHPQAQPFLFAVE